MDNYLPSLEKRIKTGRIDPSRTLLSQLHTRPAHEKQAVIQILALSPDKTAFELLSFLTSKEHKDPDIHDRLIQLIVDRAHLNFNFALIVLENADIPTIKHAAPLLRRILSNETHTDLLNKIIRSGGKNKIEDLTDDIAEFIFYDDMALKTQAVKALEQIGTSQACKALEQAARTEKCDQNILDTIQVLKTKNKRQAPLPVQPAIVKDEYQTAFEQLSSIDVKNRFKAFISLSEKGPKMALGLLKYLISQSHDLNYDLNQNQNHDLMVNILHLISRTIPREAVIDLFGILHQKKINATLKFATYSTLETFPEIESAASVVQGLSESSMFVRLAAIKTLDKNLSDFVYAEIKNKIESGKKKGEILAENILDARAKHIIEYLMISDTFSYMASNYLTRSAPIQVLDTFIEILEKRKLMATAKKYKDLRKKKMAQKREHVVVISSSETILNVYSKLIYSCGFSSLTFQNPQEAFESFVFQRPCGIICDLFLNDLTGMDLAREARELYSRDEVPFIISTLQKSLDKTLLQKELDQAGVNVICEFPAKTDQIKSWIK